MTYTSVDLDNIKEIKKACIDLDLTIKEIINAAVIEYLGKRGIKIKEEKRR